MDIANFILVGIPDSRSDSSAARFCWSVRRAGFITGSGGSRAAGPARRSSGPSVGSRASADCSAVSATSTDATLAVSDRNRPCRIDATCRLSPSSGRPIIAVARLAQDWWSMVLISAMASERSSRESDTSRSMISAACSSAPWCERSRFAVCSAATAMRVRAAFGGVADQPRVSSGAATRSCPAPARIALATSIVSWAARRRMEPSIASSAAAGPPGSDAPTPAARTDSVPRS